MRSRSRSLDFALAKKQRGKILLIRERKKSQMTAVRFKFNGKSDQAVPRRNSPLLPSKIKMGCWEERLNYFHINIKWKEDPEI